MRTFLIVLLIAFVALSLEIDTDKFSQSDSNKEKNFIARLAFWLPDEKTEDQKQKEQEDYLKNAETLDLTALEKASLAIEGQKSEKEKGKVKNPLDLDEKFKEIVDEPLLGGKGSKELSLPLFAQNSTTSQQNSAVNAVQEPENTNEANTKSSNAASSQESQVSTQEVDTSVASQAENVETSQNTNIEKVESVKAINIEVEEVNSAQIALEGFEVTKTPSLVITNFTLRNRVDTRHRGVFSFALILADGSKKYIDFSPATYNFLRMVAKNYEITIPSELKASSSDAYGFIVEVKDQSNKLLLSRFYKF